MISRNLIELGEAWQSNSLPCKEDSDGVSQGRITDQAQLERARCFPRDQIKFEVDRPGWQPFRHFGCQYCSTSRNRPWRRRYPEWKPGCRTGRIAFDSMSWSESGSSSAEFCIARGLCGEPERRLSDLVGDSRGFTGVFSTVGGGFSYSGSKPRIIIGANDCPDNSEAVVVEQRPWPFGVTILQLLRFGHRV